jgi:hypothetical protein
MVLLCWASGAGRPDAGEQGALGVVASEAERRFLSGFFFGFNWIGLKRMVHQNGLNWCGLIGLIRSRLGAFSGWDDRIWPNNRYILYFFFFLLFLNLNILTGTFSV